MATKAFADEIENDPLAIASARFHAKQHGPNFWEMSVIPELAKRYWAKNPLLVEGEEFEKAKCVRVCIPTVLTRSQ